MTVMLIRTVIIWSVLTVVMRLMGKRQLGELQVSELISTLVLSEAAAIPIADLNFPLVYALIPIAVIFLLEILLPSLFFRAPTLRKWVEGTPTFLIYQGKIRQTELHRNRITVEEFLAALRTAGAGSPGDIQYAILETSGAISVFPPPDGNTSPDPAQILVAEGRLNRSAMDALQITEADIREYLKPHHRPLKQVYLLTRNERGDVQLIWREP